jgi:hypothetical protein
MSWIDRGDEILATMTPGRVVTVAETTELPKKKDARWRAGPKGRIWLAKNRERRNAYHREYYQKNERRREYVRIKTREYRAARANG